ncbi:MAG: geobacillin-26 family protein [Firmicutes bacterium]|nr:geobacillin-26 family protein [Bacillota bacterium]
MKKSSFIKKALSVLLMFTLFVHVMSPLNLLATNQEVDIPFNSMYIQETGETVQWRVLKDTGYIRIIETRDTTQSFVATHNFVNNTMDFVITDLRAVGRANNTEFVHINTEEPSRSFKVSEDGTQHQLFENFDTYKWARAKVEQNTFSNFEYTFWTGNPVMWELRRPNPSNPVFGWYYFTTAETNNNVSFLNDFMRTVENINILEFQMMAALIGVDFAYFLLGLSGISTVFSGGTLTVAMIMAVAGAAAATATLITVTLQWSSHLRQAYLLYNQIINRRA